MINGERVAERIDACGLSQSELARQVGVTQGAISQIVNGSSFGSRHLHKIADKLGTTPGYLTNETDDPDEGAPAPPTLTHDESRMLSAWRLLSAEDRKALDRIIETMVGPRTLHAPAMGFRAEPGR